MGRPDSAGGSMKHQVVIVALPSENDHVRKLSSEKVPHLTLLYLGETEFDSAQLQHVSDFVEHASSLLPAFTLDVERRGVLGSKNADVLFFNKMWSKNIALFRNQVLQDPLISAAYHSTDQFPEWTPHLTMGYPDNPAKKDKRDDWSGPNYVTFDRIALWTGDYEGPTFDLKIYDHDMEVAMSQIKSSSSNVDDSLIHYGVKGMKWGVRKADDTGGSSPKSPVSDDHKNAVATQRKIRSGGTKTLSNQELKNLIERKNLEAQYSKLMNDPNKKTALERGNRRAKAVLATGKTLNEAQAFLNSPAGKRMVTGLKYGFMAAKVGSAFYTGGAAGAAAAGAGIAVRRMRNHYTNVG